MRFLLLLSFTACLLGQEPAKKARIEGTVNSAAGVPVVRAQVALQGPTTVQNGQPVQGGAYAATTDDKGKFSMENIDAGRNYQLTVTKQGFVQARYGARANNPAGTPLNLDAGQAMSGILITMTQQGVISGRVVDQNGDAVQNVRVAVLRRDYSTGERQLSPAGTIATTNDLGEYRVANLTAGRYYVQAAPNSTANLVGAITGTAAPKVDHLSTYYPNSPDASRATALDLAAGAELRGTDVRLNRGPVFSLRGKMFDPAGAPASGITARVVAREAASSGLSALALGANLISPRGADGSFEARGLLPGSYVIQTLASTPVNGGPKISGRTEVMIVDQDVNDVQFRLTAGATVKGTVRMEGGDLPAIVAANQQAAQRTLRTTNLTPISQPILAAALNLSVRLDGGLGTSVTGPIQSDGAFSIEGVLAAPFKVTVSPLPAGAYIKSIRFGSEDVLRNGLDLSSGGGGTLDIVLSAKGAAVRATVHKEVAEETGGLLVALWPRDLQVGQGNAVRIVRSGPNGMANFAGLPPGGYYAAAFADVDQTLLRAREFLAKLTAGATHVDLTEPTSNPAQPIPVDVEVVPVAKTKAAEEALP